MNSVHFGIDDRLWLATTLLLTVVFHFLNRRPRHIVDRAVAPLCVPERMKKGYTADQLLAFRMRADAAMTTTGQTALELYRNRVLIIDLGFAVALGLCSALIWEQVWPYLGLSPMFLWFGMVGLWTSFAYLACDLGEDFSLKLLLGPNRTIEPGQTRIASSFTIGKLVFICFSIFGLLIFLALAVIDHLTEVRNTSTK